MGYGMVSHSLLPIAYRPTAIVVAFFFLSVVLPVLKLIVFKLAVNQADIMPAILANPAIYIL